jgi:hypothetical protein
MHHTNNTIEHTGKGEVRSEDSFDDDSDVVQETPPRTKRRLGKKPDKKRKKRKRDTDDEEDEPTADVELYVSPGTAHTHTVLIISCHQTLTLQKMSRYAFA